MLCVNVRIGCVLFNELTTRFYVVTHEHREDLVIQSAEEREDTQRVLSGPEDLFAECQLVVKRTVSDIPLSRDDALARCLYLSQSALKDIDL